MSKLFTKHFTVSAYRIAFSILRNCSSIIIDCLSVLPGEMVVSSSLLPGLNGDVCTADMFMSGSDDGTVRHYDVRDPASSTTIPGMRTGEMIGEASLH